ncbi:hypothetical protein [Nocardia terpenica]|uniref:hypothetical protein n=1 Tax=Nocardia terpenica TaxID=455432 RepID=UPI000A3FEC5F|nr:hypothetical protein [Nocardia terpenica]NQE89033.1 hypothetical protein [Nocardia terpenica]
MGQHIIDDPDIRALTPAGQHLLLMLDQLVQTQTPTRHAGVLVWEPDHLARLAHGWTADQVVSAAAELESAGLVLVDTAARELWLTRHIGTGLAVRSPKMRPAVAKAIALIRSPRLRAAAVAVLSGLASANPSGWLHPDVVAVLRIGTDTPSDTVYRKASDTVSPGKSRGISPKGDTPRKGDKKTTNVVFFRSGRREKLSDTPRSSLIDFAPSMKARRWAACKCPSVDIATATAQWRNYNLAAGRSYADPERAWYGWMRRAEQLASVRVSTGRPLLITHLGPTPTPPPAAVVLAGARVTPASTEHRQMMMAQIRRTISGISA